jgi:ribonuclease J
MDDKLKIIPLGGLGEIGKNMMVIEHGDDILIVDVGLMFPSEDMLGVDLVIPDFSYVLENRHKVRGIAITHGHEDHVGALPFLLRQLDVPVYAPRLAHGLISLKLRPHTR